MAKLFITKWSSSYGLTVNIELEAFPSNSYVSDFDVNNKIRK